MGLPRRRFFNLLGGAAALPALSGTTSATDYPTRPVHLIAGFPPGGIVDIIARLIGQWLSERLGQQFVIENRAGAGSNIATEFAILNTEVNAALADPTFRSRLDDLGTEPLAGSPAEFGKFISAYIEKWGPVIRSAGIKAE